MLLCCLVLQSLCYPTGLVLCHSDSCCQSALMLCCRTLLLSVTSMLCCLTQAPFAAPPFPSFPDVLPPAALDLEIYCTSSLCYPTLRCPSFCSVAFPPCLPCCSAAQSSCTSFCPLPSAPLLPSFSRLPPKALCPSPLLQQRSARPCSSVTDPTSPEKAWKLSRAASRSRCSHYDA